MSLHDQLTVVAIYGHSDGSSALPSLRRSVHQLPGSRGLLLSLTRPRELPDGIEWRQIGPLSYVQYSIFVMHCLHTFILTDFCLLVQDDGWVIDGCNFLPEYYTFDYIGAPCHVARVGNELIQGFRWTDMPDAVVVQNGGFSLRSRRFLGTPSREGIVYEPSSTWPRMNEDIQLGCMARAAMEKRGIRYAPVALALHFSVEYLGPGVHDDLNFTKLLGQHAVTRKLVSETTVSCRLPRTAVADTFRETEFLTFLESRGLTILYEPQ